MLLLPLPESRTGIYFLLEYFQKTPQMHSNCDFILGKHENIYFAFFLYDSLQRNGRGF